MPTKYKLHGDFIECCDCFTICPCWIHDKPDQDECSALYVWRFGEGSTIGDVDVSGKAVVAATFHSKQSKGQSVYLVDESIPEAARDALLSAYAGEGEGDLQQISKITGTMIDSGVASITVADKRNLDWEVTVVVDGSQIAHLSGSPLRADGNKTASISLTYSALHSELGLKGEVDVQKMERFELGVSALPGGSIVYKGRSGMRGSFSYSCDNKAAKSR